MTRPQSRQIAHDLDEWLRQQPDGEGFCEVPPTKTLASLLCDTLKKDGFILPSEEGPYFITPDGHEFIGKGGYTYAFANELEKEELELRDARRNNLLRPLDFIIRLFRP